MPGPENTESLHPFSLGVAACHGFILPKDMLKRIMDLKGKIPKNVDISKLRNVFLSNLDRAGLKGYGEHVNSSSSTCEVENRRSSRRVLCGRITLMRTWTSNSSTRIPCTLAETFKFRTCSLN